MAFLRKPEHRRLAAALGKGRLARRAVRLAGGNCLGFRYRQWPAGNYLLRMAESPNEATRALVVQALREVAASEHPDIHRDGIEILRRVAARRSCAARRARGFMARTQSTIRFPAGARETGEEARRSQTARRGTRCRPCPFADLESERRDREPLWAALVRASFAIGRASFDEGVR